MAPHGVQSPWDTTPSFVYELVTSDAASELMDASFHEKKSGKARQSMVAERTRTRL
jgi:hypothetical protein